MEELNFDMSSIMDDADIKELFGEEETQESSSQELEENDTKGSSESEPKSKTVNTENLTIQDMFDSEGVGDGGDKETQEGNKGTTAKNTEASSPTLYPSIAKAFKVDGIFPDLEDSDIEKAVTPEEFNDLINKQIESRLNETQKRINDALNYGVEPSTIQIYENSIKNLNKITSEAIEDESDKGIQLRKSLIIQDFINRGYSKDRAETLTQRSFDSNTDIEDAKEALTQNKSFYQDEYNKLLEEAKAASEADKKDRSEKAARLKKSIIEDTKAFGEITVDKRTRERVYDVISNPIYKSSTGEGYITELQKYANEHHDDFMKSVGYLYVITDGFKSLGNLANSIKNKAVAKGIRELENTLNTTARNTDGSFRLVSGVNDNESYISSGWSIDTK